MWPEIVNSAGLVSNIAGVGFAFFFGYPQPSHDEGVGLGLEPATPMRDGRTVAEYNEDVRRRRERYLFWSRFGLGLMALGFVLQLAATWIARSSG